ncbi:thioredoxin domain-containing protein [Streptomyces sp. DSM 44917]|uniref:Thioredoxin domain-containing protein n=1 Tax=Streptomyces boetiae TaxID=3075541 RepID=A0ABU2L516_9ACTN|nr:thioredoxin domain-containing protein [Streptomyces sp. DSM 44917]MDT0306662.1 thioredoxin domain-containing protein [Streptomyces sp. DSM 44917]
MSQTNRAERRSARERLREERERDRARDRRKRNAKVAAVAVAVLAIATGAGILAAGGGGGGDAKGGGEAARPVSVGEETAPVTLTVYEDFRCPACEQFENTFRDTLHELTDSGKLRVDYHLVSIIDGNLGGNGSKYAANAALCARDAGRFREYHDVLYTHQPPETDDDFGDTTRLLDLARQVEGLDTPAFRSCVEDNAHGEAVGSANAAFLDSEHSGTPTVLLDGENLYAADTAPLTPESLRERVNELA